MAAIALNQVSSSSLNDVAAGPATQQSMSVHLETFSPLPRTICLNLPVQTTIHDVLQGLVEALNLPSSTLSSLRITTSSLGSLSIPANATLSSLQHSGTSDLPLTLKVNHVLIGGKGGFGSMLRAQGGKMSAGKNKDNNDSCRDLNGRRLSTMKEAKKLAAYLEGAEAREKALDEKKRLKYAKLERILGRAPKSSSDFETAATRLADAGEELEKDENSNGSEEEGNGEGEENIAESSSAAAKRNAAASSSKSKTASKGGEQMAGQKRKERFDDHEFVEQSREIVENVRSAVATAMLKKRKKAALAKNKGSSSTKPQAV